MYTYMSNHNYLCYMFLCYKLAFKNLKPTVTALVIKAILVQKTLLVR